MDLSVNIVQNSKFCQRQMVQKQRIAIATAIGTLMCIFLIIYTSVSRTNLGFYNTRIYSHHHRQKRSFNNDPGDLSFTTTAFDEVSSPTTALNNTCVTPACYEIASQIIYNMNRNADPCNDFYKFSCGGFSQKTSIPDDKIYVGPFSEISDKIYTQIRAILMKPIKPEEPRHVKITKNVYKSCMNKRAINNRGHDPLLKLLEELGGWPVLKQNWIENFSSIELIYKRRGIGYNVCFFLSVFIGVDFKNNTKQIINLDQPSFLISREYLVEGMNNNAVMSYYRYMVDIAVLLGAPRKVAEEQLLESLEFERQLANISLSLEKRRNLTALYNPMSLYELSQKHPTIPWKIFLNRLLRPKVAIDDDKIINVVVPDFLSRLEVLINETSQKIQANYALWRIVEALANYFSQDIRLRIAQYNKEVQGKMKDEPRWKECIRITTQNLPLSVASLYVKKYFNEEPKKTAVQMVDYIKSAFQKILQKADWMDESTRKSALKKASSMSSHIAYPNELLDDEKMEMFHKNLRHSVNEYFENILNLKIFRMNHIISGLNEPYNKRDWKYHGNAVVTNAFYSLAENSFELPAGILQGKFFNNDRPKYLNYGAIGFVIAHEITHGFDDEGRLFDETGKLSNWWNSLTEEKYLRKVECIINQYSNYTESETGLRLNTMNTLGENIADNGGIKMAYLAYNEWLLNHGAEASLPGLDFTPQQLFWISSANLWCSKIRPEILKLMITNDFHSPDEFRIIGPISNMIEFAKDFECAEGTRMNPTNKCTVW